MTTGIGSFTNAGALAFFEAFPDAEEARRLAEQELAKPEYLAAQPNAFDRASLAVLEFLERLLNPDLGNGAGGLALLITIAAVVIALLVIGILAWGRPRASRLRLAHPELLGEHDQLSAAQLRETADGLARSGDWSGAVTQRYRALARSLIERELLDPAPGATAQSIAAAAAHVFPEERAALLHAAQLFDGVRYLGTSGDEPTYLALRAVDERIMLGRIAVPA